MTEEEKQEIKEEEKENQLRNLRGLLVVAGFVILLLLEHCFGAT